MEEDAKSCGVGIIASDGAVSLNVEELLALYDEHAADVKVEHSALMTFPNRLIESPTEGNTDDSPMVATS
jgi:hypothetical protein